MPDKDALTMMDVLNKSAPALSATSDMPIFGEQSADEEAVETKEMPVEDTNEEVEDAVSRQGNETDDASDGTEEEESEETHAVVEKEAKGVGKKLERLTKERAAAEKRADDSQRQLRTALTALEQLNNRSASESLKKEEQGDPRPRREYFDDPDKYDDSLVEWSARQSAKVTKADEAKVRTEQEGRTYWDGVRKGYAKNRDSFIDDHPDYSDVAESDDVHITQHMAVAIMHADNGPAVAYHLGQNKKEVDRIASITNPMVQALEIGKIFASLGGKPKSSVSKASAPIKPLTGTTRSGSKPAVDMSMEEYAAKRQSDILNARKERLGISSSRPH